MIRIVKWNETFENAKTRKLMGLAWLQCPAGVDSAGYLSLMVYGVEGIMALGVFQAICQWSATCRPPIRGSLSRSDGKPLSMKQLAMILRMPEDVVTRSIELLMSEDVGWMEEKASVSDESASDPPVICQVSATDTPIVSVQGEERRGEESINNMGADLRKPEYIIPSKLNDPECLAASEKWFAFLASKGLQSKSPAGNEIAMEEWWRQMGRFSREDFLEAVSESIAAGRWNIRKDPAFGSKSRGPGRSSKEWIAVQKAVAQYPDDWEKRRDALGPEVFEALRRTGSSKIKGANDFELKSLGELFESHLKDVRESVGVA